MLPAEVAIVLTLEGEGERTSALGPLRSGVAALWLVGEINNFGSLVLTAWGVWSDDGSFPLLTDSLSLTDLTAADFKLHNILDFLHNYIIISAFARSCS
jgi:hypothetical protein